MEGALSRRSRRRYPSPEQLESYVAALVRCGFNPKSVWLLPDGAFKISEQDAQADVDQAELDIQAWERRQ